MLLFQIKTKIVIASDELKCDNNELAGGELGVALSLSGYTDIISGTSNETRANEEELSYVSCDEMIYLDSTALLFTPGNSTTISRINSGNCYKIEVKNCEVLEAVERFIVGLYAHGKGISI